MGLTVKALPFTFAAHLIGVAASVMVLVWCVHFRGGLAWEDANKNLIFNLSHVPADSSSADADRAHSHRRRSNHKLQVTSPEERSQETGSLDSPRRGTRSRHHRHLHSVQIPQRERIPQYVQPTLLAWNHRHFPLCHPVDIRVNRLLLPRRIKQPEEIVHSMARIAWNVRIRLSNRHSFYRVLGEAHVPRERHQTSQVWIRGLACELHGSDHDLVRCICDAIGSWPEAG
ncbi:Probable ascorbate-specific transmembrane electron transporter 1 [Linum perenne]